MTSSRITRIGLISDTHGLLRPEARAALEDSDRIIHAGDIGDATILSDLARIAPVTAIRGNNDMAPWASSLHDTETLTIGGITIFVIHNVADLKQMPPPAGCRVIISGHSHKPLCREENGVLFINPGSAGPRRFKLPIAVGKLRIDGGQVAAELIELSIA
ncbi:metallophosphoesterase family protein [Dongia soli]|uniref:Phosphoesterase n=1 Tax=Dongia soli TaxID=600628 RepID=A0ABU5EEE6_9PROT|nr:metallophosphoesterase family protein [Dongia soli]MDY0884591.1 metallophosphoesterase family protein [Dongia soli]